MTDNRTERYFKFIKKNESIFEKLLKNKATVEDRRNIVYCLTELYFISQSIVKLTKKISETNMKFTKDDLDTLLGNLIDLRIEIYDKMVDWIKDFKKPLNLAINNVDKLGGDKPGTNSARKIIRSSTKQFDINLEKIKYYSAHNKQNKKSEHHNK